MLSPVLSPCIPRAYAWVISKVERGILRLHADRLPRKFFAHEFTKRRLPDSIEQLTSALVETQIEIGHRREQLIAEIEGNLEK